LGRGSDTLVSVDVNGVAATLDGNKFSADVPVASDAVYVPVVATSHFQSGFTGVQRSTIARGNGTTSALVAKGAANPGSIVEQVRPSALTKLGPSLVPAIQSAVPAEAFSVPLGTVAGPGGLGMAYVGSTPTLPTPEVDLVATDGGLQATLTY